MNREIKLIDRKGILEDCKKKPFKLIFTMLGDYDSLDFVFKTEMEAKRKLKALVKKYKEDIKFFGGYHAEILKRLEIESKEVKENE